MATTKKSTTSNTASKVKKVESPPVVEVKTDKLKVDSTPEVVEVKTNNPKLADESIDKAVVTHDKTVDKSEVEMKSSTSATIRDTARVIFQSDVDTRFKVLDMAFALFEEYQDKPITNKLSVELTKNNIETYLKLAGVNKISVNHTALVPKVGSDNKVIIDGAGDVVNEWQTVQSTVDNDRFKSLVIDVFAFTRLIAITDKMSESDKVHRNSTRLVNKLCRHKIVENVSGKDVTRYEFVTSIKPIKDFARICFADKSTANFFSSCIDKSKTQIGQVVAEIVQVVSDPKLNAIEKYGMKPAPKASGTEMFTTTLGMLQDTTKSKLDILIQLKKDFPIALADLELPQAKTTTLETGLSVAAG